MVAAVEDRYLDVDDRITGKEATSSRLLNSLLDSRDELARDGTAEDVVGEDDAAASDRKSVV